MASVTIINRPTRVSIALRGVQGVPGSAPGGIAIPAAQVSFDNSGTEIGAENVQAAIREVASATGQIDPDLHLLYTIARDS